MTLRSRGPRSEAHALSGCRRPAQPGQRAIDRGARATGQPRRRRGLELGDPRRIGAGLDRVGERMRHVDAAPVLRRQPRQPSVCAAGQRAPALPPSQPERRQRQQVGRIDDDPGVEPEPAQPARDTVALTVTKAF